jgi:hypothetical protein
MKTTTSVLSTIALDAREFADAAATDGFDPADALEQIIDIANAAEKKLAGIPLDAPIAVLAILGSESMCPDVIAMIEGCYEQVVRYTDAARAVKAKLQAFVDLYGAPDTPTCAHARSSAEGDAWDSAVALIARIEKCQPSLSPSPFIFSEGPLSPERTEEMRLALKAVTDRAGDAPFVLSENVRLVSAGNVDAK